MAMQATAAFRSQTVFCCPWNRHFPMSVRRRRLAIVIGLGLGLLLTTLPTPAQVPPDAADKFRVASEAMRAGNLDDAAAGFASVVKEAPAFAEGYFNLGLVRGEQGRHDEAIASFEKALSLKPRLHGANLFLGIAHYKAESVRPGVGGSAKGICGLSEGRGRMW
jgi:tetratricopeptide (TPR) repeat protein